MAGASLLTLIDDIASFLDDVSVMSKVAAKQSLVIIGDDLALSAEQVIKDNPQAERELPIVWAVAKGSFVNKMLLIPLALAISTWAAWGIRWLMLIGGIFLCYEGAHKLMDFIQKVFSHRPHNEKPAPVSRPSAAPSRDEKLKIRGAIRTDFILSAEIIVLTIASITQAGFLSQVLILMSVALALTLSVYGVVAVIVKLDDLGVWFLKKPGISAWFGRGIVIAAPRLMKMLSWVGMVAMFLVGGGIFTHYIPLCHSFVASLVAAYPSADVAIDKSVQLILGMLIGGMIVALQALFLRWRSALPVNGS